MPNSYFQFKQFTIQQDRTAMKVTTDACLFGAWVSHSISQLPGKSLTVLDIGAGTGLLSLMVAQKNRKVVIEAIEIDPEAAKQAEKNSNSSPFAEQIEIINADLRRFSSEKKYDVIISNPPFYENELKSTEHKKNTAHHGITLTLNELLSFIKNNLHANGVFYLLLPYKRVASFNELLNQNDLELSAILLVRQSTEHSYFRALLSGKIKSASASESSVDEIAIKDGSDTYTSAFTHLLSDYYLAL